MPVGVLTTKQVVAMEDEDRSGTEAVADVRRVGAARILAVLEGRRTDSAVCSAAADVARAAGGFLTLVAVVAEPWPMFDCGPLFGGCVTKDYLREHARAGLSLARAHLSGYVSVRTAVDEGSTMKTIVRRIDVAAYDLVIVRRRWFMRSRLRHGNVALIQVSLATARKASA